MPEHMDRLRHTARYASVVLYIGAIAILLFISYIQVFTASSWMIAAMNGLMAGMAVCGWQLGRAARSTPERIERACTIPQSKRA